MLAIVGGVFLLWPGVCFLSIGLHTDVAASLIGLVILLIAGWLLWIGFGRKSPKRNGGGEGPTPEV